MEIKITKMNYSRVFSLGNYENEKIGIECDVPEGIDTTQAYIEMKEVVENAHNLRKEIRDYYQAKHILTNPDAYRGSEVKTAQRIVKEFENKYPNLDQVKVHAMLSEGGEPLEN